MAEIPFEIIGFDLDGTLLDTSMELAASLNHALESADRPPVDPGSVRSLVGMGARHMLNLALEQSGGTDQALVKRLLPVLIDHYDAHLGSNAPAFDGLLAAMDDMQAAGVRLAVVTNKFEHLAVKLLERVDMHSHFDTIIGGDTMDRIMGSKGNGKPARHPIDEMIRRCGGEIGETPAVFVGDSIFDVKAAHNAEIPAVAVSFGFLHQPVEELGADAVIDHYDDLIPALQKIPVSR